ENKKMLPMLLIGVAALLFIVAGVWLWHRAASRGRSVRALAASPAFVDVTVRSTPAGAQILRDGQELGIAAPTLTVRLPEGKSHLEARLDGYESGSEMVDSSAGHHGEVNFALVPLSQQLRVAGRGTLSLDGGSASALPMGAFSDELSAGSHTLHWRGRGGYDATFQVNVRDGEPAALAAPIHASQLGSALLVSVASGQARVYTNPAMPVTIDGVAKGIVNNDGLETTLAPGRHTIVAGKTPGALTSR